MIGPVFVDTNVIVYRHDARDPENRAVPDSGTSSSGPPDRKGELQVLQEFYAVITRKVTPTASPSTARSIVRKLMSRQPASIDPAMLERAWLLESRHLLSWRDPLIAAAAQTCGGRALLTEDLRHGYEFSGPGSPAGSARRGS